MRRKDRLKFNSEREDAGREQRGSKGHDKGGEHEEVIGCAKVLENSQHLFAVGREHLKANNGPGEDRLRSKEKHGSGRANW